MNTLPKQQELAITFEIQPFQNIFTRILQNKRIRHGLVDLP